MDNIIISSISSSSPLYQQVWDLREEVLRKPLGMSLKNEDLSRDHTDLFFVASAADKVIGCVMLHNLGQGQAQLRQMAVYDSWQGKGVGRQLVQAFERYAAASGFDKVVLHARDVAKGFYSSLGYALVGDVFKEVGIDHYIMEKAV